MVEREKFDPDERFSLHPLIGEEVLEEPLEKHHGDQSPEDADL